MRNLKLLNLYHANAKRGSFKAEGNTIYLYDMIVSSEIESEWFGGVTPKQVADQLKDMSGDVQLRINSPGGDVFAAVAMCQMIREYKGKVTAHVDGYAASAASIVACAADECVMAKGSMMMIHKAWTIGIGNADDMRATSDLLEKIDGQISQGYADKSGKDIAGFMDAMAAETWFTEQEAVDAGLADRVADDESKKSKNAANWNLSAFENAPKVAVAPAPAADPAVIDNTETERERRVRSHAVRMLQLAA